MKEYFLPLFVLVVLVGVMSVIGYVYGIPRLSPYFENQVRGMLINEVGVDLIVADSPRERAEGLSNRRSLDKNTGLLLIFDTSDFHGLWMKDMYFPIDVIWIDENLKIVDITESMAPDSYPKVFEPKTKARMALEVNALFVAANKIKVGDTVTINEAYLPEDLKPQ